MTRNEREAMNDLSLQVFGRKSYWQKLLRKGELYEDDAMTANGTPIKVKRLKYLTVEDILAKMKQQIESRKEAAAKAAEEATKQAQGDANGTEEKGQSEEVGQTNEASGQEEASSSN